MALNFPANPSPGSTYEAPNGVTYIWNDSIQSWVVEALNYDDNYVNITGDRMTGPLDFHPFTNEIGIWWGGNPKIRFDKQGTTELRGNFSAHSRFGVNTGIHFDSTEGDLIFRENDTRLTLTQSKTILRFGTEEYLHVDADGVKYLGNFLQDKNVVTVEYVANEVQNLQTQIDLLTYDLSDNITDVINDKAVLLTGNQNIQGNKKFKTQVFIDRGPDIGDTAANSFIIKGNVGNNQSYNIMLKDYRRATGSSTSDSIMYYGNISAENDIVNKKYVTDNTLKSVSGTSGDDNDTGIRVNTKSNNNQKIYAVKASRDQYGVTVAGQLPTGNSTPNSNDLNVGQMYFDKSQKRVFIRVN